MHSPALRVVSVRMRCACRKDHRDGAGMTRRTHELVERRDLQLAAGSAFASRRAHSYRVDFELIQPESRPGTSASRAA